MKSLILNIDNSSGTKLYKQIYSKLKEDILTGDIKSGEKMPSLRRIAKDNGVSLTTIEAAYNQLAIEGYIIGRQRSGFFVADGIEEAALNGEEGKTGYDIEEILSQNNNKNKLSSGETVYDEESFDFAKWKKCMNKVFNNYSNVLMTEPDIKGELALRYEISKYLYQRRGIKADPNQIVVGAGTQQLTAHLIRILREIKIFHAATEMPGYGKVREIFKEEGFPITEVPILKNGIVIEKLPKKSRCVVYVNPSNQFPTGAVMPITRRYELIQWASSSNNYILEDDYDSELRYFGKPIAPLKSIDTNGRVIYMGAFASTLFDAIKISYMVLPAELMDIFENIKHKYTQTCSKAEQMCLALYMEEGYYHINIKKCRKLYEKKSKESMKIFETYGTGLVKATDSQSGLSVMLKIFTDISGKQLCDIGKRLGLYMKPVEDMSKVGEQVICFYFYKVPISMLKILIKMYIGNIKKLL